MGVLEPINRQYSRNTVVCAPTAVGNLIGWPAGLVLAAPVWLGMRPFSERNARYSANAVATVPTSVGGLLLGTPFLPLSFLTSEMPCSWEYL